ncbi:hypothetical protein [Cetobacterium sp.]|uniref:hypothetical protein n=1 Tax=Cetobacterium sp. TaxID=2071632 RepID=UPI003F3503FD
MTNIRKVLEIIFKNNDFQGVIEKYLNNIDLLKQDEFSKLFSHLNPTLYNKDEIQNLYQLIFNKWIKDNGNESIFNILTFASKDILKENTHDIYCKYNEILRWREISYQLGEDIFTTSFLARNDLYRLDKRVFFAWKPIISNDNKRLQEILKRGLAENHFHLKGSAPHCDLNWIYLMNNIKKCSKNLNKFDKEFYLSAKISIKNFNSRGTNFTKTSDFIKLAFLIRGHLYLKLYKKPEFNIENILNSNIGIELEEGINVLNDILQIEKDECGKKINNMVIDYFIPKDLNNLNYNENIFLCGERIFLYDMFSKIFEKDKDIGKETQTLFYLYLLIKQKFRSEIVQINREVGFGNFCDYQGRKSLFIDKLFKNAVNCMAIKSSTTYDYLSKIEARIAPPQKLKDIKDYDSDIKNESLYGLNKNIENFFNSKETEDKRRDKFFYTIHFIKKAEKTEDLLKEDKSVLMITSKNYSAREEINKEVDKILELKKNNEIFRERVLGIDAANVEIGCRPEVLATAFRKIRESDIENKFKPFGVTYHVGEEFLDIIDGLRAIDECILFLNLENGNRLGHALALGISPKEYYESKGKILILPKQDLLDNITWIYYKIKEFNINVSTSFLMKLRSLFDKYFLEIYKTSEITMELYYDSWKLRGDCPKIYLDNIDKNNFIEKYSKNPHPSAVIVRKNKQAKNLYTRYHYDPKVKLEGAEIVEFSICSQYIDICEQLQKKFQEKISNMGIFIESNPSSNILIGTINRYADHPIKKFYNLGLTHDLEELHNSYQICVSINTDDQGVFGTSLENEYALLALALEKEKNENGNSKYNPTMIYEWLDKIRQMGLEQSFLD